MLHIKRILIPLDFSPASVAAAEYALAFGKELEAEEIHLIHILVLGPANDLYTDVLDVQDPQHHLQNLPEEWQETWHRLQHQVESAGYAFVPGMLQSDSITTPLVKYAQTHQIDLVVMATHGRTGIAHRLLGSVADGLIEYAPCPVLTLRADLAEKSYRDVRKILVPLDFSERSAEALRVAREYAQRTDAGLTALNVIARTEHSDLPASPWEKAYNDKNPDVRQIHKLEAFIRYAGGPKVRLQTALMYGDPVEASQIYLEAYPQDLILMSTRGRSGDGLFHYGSTAEELVRRAPCPVLTFKQGDRIRFKHARKKTSIAEA
ncbi:MAG TPA: hypothetical protein DIW24_03140 [Bacteroidetes bacterium]|nr:hypothetical protein [Bacteroidota bacterium]HRR07697.1 universal stress protein [Rhodothermales bacterium]